MRLSHCSAVFWLCILLMMCSVPAKAEDYVQPPSGAVDGPTAHRLMRYFAESLVVLDVRTVSEYAEAHVTGSLNIPVQEIKMRAEEIPADRPVLIICRTGKRAAAAYDILKPLRTGNGGKSLWYLKGTPEFKQDGSFVFP